MTPESPVVGPNVPPSTVSGNNHFDADSQVAALTGSLDESRRANTQLEAEKEQLREQNRELQNALRSNRCFNWCAIGVGSALMLSGAALIVWTLMLRFKTLKHKGGMLGHGEFVAGIAGGCVLILAVVVLIVLWRSASRPPRATV
jgi:hypothetical protein